MSLVISILLVVVAAAFVAAPLFTAQTLTEPRSPTPRVQLERQKVEAYTAIKEAEFDYRMGKLSETDLEALRHKYSAQALEAIAALDAAPAGQPRKLAEARRPTRIAFCPACGRGVPPRANFCPACGRSLQEAVA